MSLPDNQSHHFRLYLVGQSPNSAQALANLRALCGEYLPDRHTIEVVDVLLEPERALKDGILLMPALVRLRPAPSLTLVGNLSVRAVVLEALGLGLL